ncbi:hypothetical protein JRO89_XS04G0057800 [Xanthoceras sorbifolium]|uniref:Uncharacterized protein n=1 Tax=Xanthoceras sorbifolium TaxID=99658 RepID=A0ABQ8I4A9_9ROSI|nr:hypothetical protein JRO89_XS04G0057800 [Xanthoceras sorbifolium]
MAVVHLFIGYVEDMLTARDQANLCSKNYDLSVSYLNFCQELRYTATTFTVGVLSSATGMVFMDMELGIGIVTFCLQQMRLSVWTEEVQDEVEVLEDELEVPQLQSARMLPYRHSIT